MSDAILDREAFATKFKDARDFIAGVLDKGNDKFLVHVLALLQRKLKNEPDYMFLLEHAQLSYKQLLRREEVTATCETRVLVHAYKCRNVINTFSYADLLDQMGMCTFNEVVSVQKHKTLVMLREKGFLVYFDEPNSIHQFTEAGLARARAILDKKPDMR